MKKRIILFISCVLLLLCCSCGEGKKIESSTYAKEYVKAEDYDITRFSWLGNPSSVAETENQIFFVAASYLFCMDKSSLEAYPLCFKTDCAHTEEKDSLLVPRCDAYIGGYLTGFVGVYNDKLYTISSKEKKGSDYDLLEMNLDGSGKKLLVENLKNAGFSYADDILIHRGVLYYITLSHNLEGKSINEIHGIPLASKKKKPVVVYTSENTLSAMFPYMNEIYFREEEAPDNGEDYENSHISVYDIQTGETSRAFPDSGDIYYAVYGVEGGNIVFTRNNKAILYDTETKTVKKEDGPIARFEEEHSNWQVNAECIMDDFVMFTCFDDKDSDFVRDLIVCDGEGKEVCVLEGESWSSDGGRMVTIDDEEYYFKYSASSEPYSIKLYKKSDLLNGLVHPENILEADSWSDLSPSVNYIVE